MLISWLKERKEHHLPFVEQAYHIKRWNALKINSSLRKVHFVWNFVSTAMQVCFLNLGHFLSYKSNFIENLHNFHHTKETCFKKKNNFLPHWAVSSCIYIPLHVPIFCTLKVPSPQSRNWHAVHFERKTSIYHFAKARARCHHVIGNSPHQCSVCFSITGHQQLIVLQHQSTQYLNGSADDPTGNHSFTSPSFSWSLKRGD